MLFNKTKKKKIISRVKIADSFLKRFRGLMFSGKKDFAHALVFVLEKESRFEASIHMMFVFFPIDVLWLDGKRRVVDKREFLRPFALNATPKKPAAFIIELPAGKANGTSIGDELAWN